ncbi:MAG: hypothetical protein HOM58_20700 [Rhodospirillaceae bacterium]|jgi:regulatory protein|nr:hypothetical protein [Rhodospirillaceae bacterium]MBT5459737.1 hypothetical protein [Rhodospirillaceae bacterium]
MPDKPRVKNPRKMTPKRLENIAIYYCQRFLTSEAKLAKHLENRLFREVADAQERVEFAKEIPAIVKKLAGAGLANDREAASAKLRGALRSGYARKAAVAVAARSARVDREIVEAELAEAARDALPDIDFENLDRREEGAALATESLRRARRGPWRPRGQDETTKRRDIAWLQRRGFGFEDIRSAMDIDFLEE